MLTINRPYTTSNTADSYTSERHPHAHNQPTIHYVKHSWPLHVWTTSTRSQSTDHTLRQTQLTAARLNDTHMLTINRPYTTSNTADRYTSERHPHAHNQPTIHYVKHSWQLHVWTTSTRSQSTDHTLRQTQLTATRLNNIHTLTINRPYTTSNTAGRYTSERYPHAHNQPTIHYVKHSWPLHVWTTPTCSQSTDHTLRQTQLTATRLNDTHTLTINRPYTTSNTADSCTSERHPHAHNQPTIHYVKHSWQLHVWTTPTCSQSTDHTLRQTQLTATRLNDTHMLTINRPYTTSNTADRYTSERHPHAHNQPTIHYVKHSWPLHVWTTPTRSQSTDHTLRQTQLTAARLNDTLMLTINRPYTTSDTADRYTSERHPHAHNQPTIHYVKHSWPLHIWTTPTRSQSTDHTLRQTQLTAARLNNIHMLTINRPYTTSNTADRYMSEQHPHAHNQPTIHYVKHSWPLHVWTTSTRSQSTDHTLRQTQLTATRLNNIHMLTINRPYTTSNTADRYTSERHPHAHNQPTIHYVKHSWQLHLWTTPTCSQSTNHTLRQTQLTATRLNDTHMLTINRPYTTSNTTDRHTSERHPHAHNQPTIHYVKHSWPLHVWTTPTCSQSTDHTLRQTQLTAARLNDTHMLTINRPYTTSNTADRYTSERHPHAHNQPTIHYVKHSWPLHVWTTSTRSQSTDHTLRQTQLTATRLNNIHTLTINRPYTTSNTADRYTSERHPHAHNQPTIHYVKHSWQLHVWTTSTRSQSTDHTLRQTQLTATRLNDTHMLTINRPYTTSNTADRYTSERHQHAHNQPTIHYVKHSWQLHVWTTPTCSQSTDHTLRQTQLTATRLNDTLMLTINRPYTTSDTADRYTSERHPHAHNQPTIHYVKHSWPLHIWTTPTRSQSTDHTLRQTQLTATRLNDTHMLTINRPYTTSNTADRYTSERHPHAHNQPTIHYVKHSWQLHVWTTSTCSQSTDHTLRQTQLTATRLNNIHMLTINRPYTTSNIADRYTSEQHPHAHNQPTIHYVKHSWPLHVWTTSTCSQSTDHTLRQTQLTATRLNDTHTLTINRPYTTSNTADSCTSERHPHAHNQPTIHYVKHSWQLHVWTTPTCSQSTDHTLRQTQLTATRLNDTHMLTINRPYTTSNTADRYTSERHPHAHNQPTIHYVKHSWQLHVWTTPTCSQSTDHTLRQTQLTATRLNDTHTLTINRPYTTSNTADRYTSEQHPHAHNQPTIHYVKHSWPLHIWTTSTRSQSTDHTLHKTQLTATRLNNIHTLTINRPYTTSNTADRYTSERHPHAHNQPTIHYVKHSWPLHVWTTPTCSQSTDHTLRQTQLTAARLNDTHMLTINRPYTTSNIADRYTSERHPHAHNQPTIHYVKHSWPLHVWTTSTRSQSTDHTLRQTQLTATRLNNIHTLTINRPYTTSNTADRYTSEQHPHAHNQPTIHYVKHSWPLHIWTTPTCSQSTDHTLRQTQLTATRLNNIHTLTINRPYTTSNTGDGYTFVRGRHLHTHNQYTQTQPKPTHLNTFKI